MLILSAEHRVTAAQLSWVRQACAPAHVVLADGLSLTETPGAAAVLDLRRLDGLGLAAHLPPHASVWIAPIDRLVHLSAQPQLLRAVVANPATQFFGFSDEVTVGSERSRNDPLRAMAAPASLACQRILWARSGRQLLHLVAQLTSTAPQRAPLTIESLGASGLAFPECLVADAVYDIGTTAGLQTFSETRCSRAAAAAASSRADHDGFSTDAAEQIVQPPVRDARSSRMSYAQSPECARARLLARLGGVCVCV